MELYRYIIDDYLIDYGRNFRLGIYCKKDYDRTKKVKREHLNDKFARDLMTKN
jgi:hypothetical protein